MLEEEKFYSPISDSVFKVLFFNEKSSYFYKNIIKEFINIDLEEYESIDREADNIKSISYRFDILLENKKDKKIKLNIEMNSNKDYIKSIDIKNDSYLYYIAGKNFSKGEKYSNFKTIQICFNNYSHPMDKNIGIATYIMSDEKNRLEKNNVVKYEIFLPTLEKICYSKFKEYIKLLRAESYEEIESIVRDCKELKDVVEEIKKINEIEDFDLYYDQEHIQKKLYNSIVDEFTTKFKEETLLMKKEAIKEAEAKIKEEAFNDGQESGRKEAIIQTAKKMLEKGSDVDFISEVTGLTTKQIESIKNEEEE